MIRDTTLYLLYNAQLARWIDEILRRRNPSNLLGKNLEGKPIQEKSNGEGVWKDEGWGTPLARRCVRAIDNQPFFPSLLHESIPLRVTPPRSFRFFTLPLRPSQGEGGYVY